jgi:hypothetical protein
MHGPQSVLLLLFGSTAPTDQDARWMPGERQRYVIEQTTSFPLALGLQGVRNADLRITAFQVRMVADCVAGAWEGGRSPVSCRIEDAALSAAGPKEEEARLGPVLLELRERLMGSTYAFSVDKAGAHHSPGFVGLDRLSLRGAAQAESLRLLVRGAFAGLELPPQGDWGEGPKNGAHRGECQESPLLMQYPIPGGTQGSLCLRFRDNPSPNGESGDLHAGISYGVGLAAPAASELKMVIHTGGDLWLEPQHGRLHARTWWLEGRPTPSSTVSRGGGISGNVDSALLGALPIRAWRVGGQVLPLAPDAPRPDLGETGVETWQKGGSWAILLTEDRSPWANAFPRPADARWDRPRPLAP